MGKTIGLKQLSLKKYRDTPGLDHWIRMAIGNIEDSFDAIAYGPSGNGKTNFTVQLLKALIKAMNCKAEYVAYEEGHGKTIQTTLIDRHNMLEEVGNRLVITEPIGFEELEKRMSRKQSAKIWVIDSLQAAGFTYEQCKTLKEKFVLSRKKKILIYISWADGTEPKGSVAKSVKYYANIKIHVHDFIAYTVSRYYGGNNPYIIYEDGAKKRMTKKKFNAIQNSIPPEPKKIENETVPVSMPADDPGDHSVRQPDSETNCKTD